MPHFDPPRAIDYLIIGHFALDRTETAGRLGGTVAYAGLTAAALGRRVGIVTSVPPDLDLRPLSDFDLSASPAVLPTSFENRYDHGSRQQRLLSLANPLAFEDIPLEWRRPPVVHLAPIAGEVDPALSRMFPNSFVGITAQGWLRAWDQDGVVRVAPFDSIADFLPAADAVVVSIEDLGGDLDAGKAMAARCRLLVVTEGARGAMVFKENDVRRIPAPVAEEIDPTGAGDIFAAVFFHRLSLTGDPWASARLAVRIATASVAMVGVAGIPEMVAEIESERQAIE